MLNFVVKLLLVLPFLAQCLVSAVPMFPSEHDALWDRYYGGQQAQLHPDQNWIGQINDASYHATGPALQPGFNHMPQQHNVHNTYLATQPFFVPQMDHQVPLNHDTYQPRELDQVDYNFLHSLSHELATQGHGATSASHQDASHRSHGQTGGHSDWEDVDLDVFPAPGRQTDPRWERLVGEKRERLRGSRWPAPEVLTKLGLWRPLKEHGFSRNLVFKDTDEIRARINSHLFADKIHWVDLRPFTARSSEWRNRMPTTGTSQRMPFLRIVDADGTPLRLYLTEHNMFTQEGSALKQTALENVPLFMFWGVSERASDVKHDIAFLGSGVLMVQDNHAVDEHLRGMISAAQHYQIHL